MELKARELQHLVVLEVQRGAVGGSSLSAGAGEDSNNGKDGGRVGSKSSEPYTPYRRVTYIPKAGEDPQVLARRLVWRVGGASKSKSKSFLSIPG